MAPFGHLLVGTRLSPGLLGLRLEVPTRAGALLDVVPGMQIFGFFCHGTCVPVRVLAEHRAHVTKEKGPHTREDAVSVFRRF